MEQVRLKSSFIYLANAVRDLAGNWRVLTLVLAPLVILASLCLLPDALELQHQLAHAFQPGVQSIAWSPVQMPYAPSRAASQPLFPRWETTTLHVVFVLLTLAVNLVVLCALARLPSEASGASPLQEAIAIYRRAFELVLSYLWIAILQLLATLIGFVLLIIPGFVAFIWLYFAQYALVIDNRRSWPALLHSRDLMRKRFFKVASRIVVFLAVWSGYNSWAAGTFVAISWLLQVLGAITGFIWVGVFAADLLSVSVAFVTTAFFTAAGVRLYRDLGAALQEAEQSPSAPPPTAPLPVEAAL